MRTATEGDREDDSGAPRRDVVALTLAAIAVVATLCCGFVGVAPNRLMSAVPVMMWSAAPEMLTAMLAALVMVVIAAAALRPRPSLSAVLLFAGIVALLLILHAAGIAATQLQAHATPAARVELGAGFWLDLLCALGVVIDALQRRRAGIGSRVAVVGVVVVALVIMARAGDFAALSLAREYAIRRAAFATALWRHSELVAVTIGLALVLGAPLGVLAARRRRTGAVIFALLNVVQTLPSLALFAVLLAAISGLALVMPGAGLSGVGFLPAAIGLVLYALLPAVRNAAAAIEATDSATVDAARGLGFSARQIFWQVELPLGLPVFLAGLRIVGVQSVGLAVVAALIGAGGLGTFVFQGLGQYAIDLVLLGALPVIAMALALDFILGLAIAAARRAS